jgi:hypothetical protein
MHFSTHIKRIAESIKDALGRPQPELIARLRECLLDARQLLKTDSFDYWIRQMDETPSNEIPTTIYGVTEARRTWTPLPDSRSSLEAALNSSCEKVLTYCAEDDMCEAQGIITTMSTLQPARYTKKVSLVVRHTDQLPRSRRRTPGLLGFRSYPYRRGNSTSELTSAVQ